ncbi:acyltransferase LovD [Podospora aff. communis PSN243]|uniref:Acyltransferase LovD n=1 Tax=Podospora aff. communis PSN243 TaxID=3040156 RepID=A0AAV9H3B2_9PEZI|nr:acyltransferase LovD [Podospora aff. communis PSN243]
MEALDTILARYTAQGDDTQDKLLGVAFVVVDGNKTLYEGSAGRISILSDSARFTPSTLTWAASLSKIITTPAILTFVERGLFALDSDVRPLIPELAGLQILRGFNPETGAPILENNDSEITLRHLLTHTAGLATDTNLHHTLAGWTTPLKFTPGQGWCYGTATDWAAQLVKPLTGQTIGAYLDENILRPLGMADTTFHSVSKPNLEKAGCSLRDQGTGSLRMCPLPVPLEPPVESAGAGLWTTARDHARILQALLSISQEQKEGGILQKETVDEMFRPQLNDMQRMSLQERANLRHNTMMPEFPPGTMVQHGIGGLINREDIPGKRRAGSMQWMGMANSHWWIDRATGIAATLIVNVQPFPDDVVIKLYDELERAVYGELLAELHK